jgi:ABC-type sugar transport system ATPase subunit
MLLGRMPTRALGFVVDWREAERVAGRTLKEFGFDGVAPNMLVRNLSIARQQIVEIGKALVAPPSILILDEPTAVLSAHETSILFKAIRRLAGGGRTILYISHRLEEIFEIADEVVVLKDGRSVLQGSIDSLDQAHLIEAMVGRPLRTIFSQRKPQLGRVVLEARRLESPGRFADINLVVRAGEIVGMFGLVGAGRTEVANAVFGAVVDGSGKIRIDGAEPQIHTPADAVRAGVAMIPEDRKTEGLALDASALDNVSLASLGRFSHLGVLDQGERRRRVEAATTSLAVRPHGIDGPARRLSGGNQQKVVARWLLVEGTKLYLFDEPTRGVDGARDGSWLSSRPISSAWKRCSPMRQASSPGRNGARFIDHGPANRGSAPSAPSARQPRRCALCAGDPHFDRLRRVHVRCISDPAQCRQRLTPDCDERLSEPGHADRDADGRH